MNPEYLTDLYAFSSRFMISGVELNPSAPGVSKPARTQNFDESKAFFGIGINDAVNGVVLPDTRYNSNVPIPGYPHWGPGFHSGVTHNNINDRLADAVESVDPSLIIPGSDPPEIDPTKLDLVRANDPGMLTLIKQRLTNILVEIRNIFLSGSLP